MRSWWPLPAALVLGLAPWLSVPHIAPARALGLAAVALAIAVLLRRQGPWAAAGAALLWLVWPLHLDLLAGAPLGGGTSKAELLPLVGPTLSRAAWPIPPLPARELAFLSPTPGWPVAVLGVLAVAALAAAKERRTAAMALGAAGLATLIASKMQAGRGEMTDMHAGLVLPPLLVALGAALGPRLAPVAVALAIPLVLTDLRWAPMWRSELLLWSGAHAAAPTAQTAGRKGMALAEAGLGAEALPLLTEALAAEPPWCTAAAPALTAALQQEQPVEAVRLGKTATERCPPDDAVLGRYALALAGQGAWEEAMALLPKMKADPGQYGMVVLAADCVRRRDLAAYARVQKLWKGAQPLDRAAGSLLRLSGDPDSADILARFARGELPAFRPREPGAR